MELWGLLGALGIKAFGALPLDNQLVPFGPWPIIHSCNIPLLGAYLWSRIEPETCSTVLALTDTIVDDTVSQWFRSEGFRHTDLWTCGVSLPGKWTPSWLPH